MQILAAIRDIKGAFSAPQTFPTLGLAERQFADIANDDKSQVNKYPQDFSLWKIGEYDEQTGIVYTANDQSIVKICDAESLIKKH